MRFRNNLGTDQKYENIFPELRQYFVPQMTGQNTSDCDEIQFS